MINFNPTDLYYVPYDIAVTQIKNASLLQYRGNSLFCYLIQLGTLGIHVHSAKIRRNGDNRVDILEMVERIGGRAQPLRGQVALYPGKIDVFQIDEDRWPEFSPEGAVSHMRKLTSHKYGRWGIIRLATMRAFAVRLYLLFSGFDYDDDSEQHQNPFCSHAVCSAFSIGGGVDPVPRKPDHLVSPNDLTWSMFFKYQFTLIP